MATPKQHTQAGFPPCVSLSIEFNAHAAEYMTVQEWIDHHAPHTGVEWVSPEERQRAIDTDSVWTCQWYPDSPVGFCALAASSFEALMSAVNK